jgi:hypothetical protein
MTAALAACVMLALGGCSGDDAAPPAGDQRELNSVSVGSYDLLSAADSEAVSQIGLELVLLGPPLQTWYGGSGDRAALLEQMTTAVDRIDAALSPDRAPEVRTTFTPYVTTWRELLAALGADDTAAAEDAIERLRDLDQIRIDRVVDVYGEDAARALGMEEGVVPTDG